MAPRIATREEWLAERAALLRDEKALMRYKDYIAERRRALPWVALDKTYEFDTVDGTRTLEQLFDGHSQLIVYHFMFGPDWDKGCPGCTQVANTLNQSVLTLPRQDTAFVAVSRAALDKLQHARQRLGWSFNWVSSGGSDFNVDFHATRPPAGAAAPWSYQGVEFDRDENHGISVFALRDGTVYHTYSSYQRSVEMFMADLQLMDLCPSGRGG